jgi:diguanylate cyclase (GGDEF)-like protein
MTDGGIARPARVVASFLIGGIVAVAVTMLVAVGIGSFNGAEILLLLAVDIACVVALALGAHALSRRINSNEAGLWALSRRDELTGVGNYRALHERLGEELSRHTRRQHEFALILIDLDGFKQINEGLGHLEGDRLLAQIGEALAEEVRGEDSVFRQGGDEFAVIAPETNGEEAEDVAARLRARVRRCSRDGVRISAGTGFAIFPADGRSISDLIDRADRDLLGAKRNSWPR